MPSSLEQIGRFSEEMNLGMSGRIEAALHNDEGVGFAGVPMAAANSEGRR